MRGEDPLLSLSDLPCQLFLSGETKLRIPQLAARLSNANSWRSFNLTMCVSTLVLITTTSFLGRTPQRNKTRWDPWPEVRVLVAVRAFPNIPPPPSPARRNPPAVNWASQRLSLWLPPATVSATKKSPGKQSWVREAKEA